MAILTKYPTSNAVVSGGWTDPTNAYTDDTTYATASPTKNSAPGPTSEWSGFDFSTIPAGSTINSVTTTIRYYLNGTATLYTIRAWMYDGATAIGAEANETARTVEGDWNPAFGATPTLTQLKSSTFKIRVEGDRGNTNNVSTYNLDYIGVTVDYTAPTGQEELGAANISSSATFSATGGRIYLGASTISSNASTSFVGGKELSGQADFSSGTTTSIGGGLDVSGQAELESLITSSATGMVVVSGAGDAQSITGLSADGVGILSGAADLANAVDAEIGIGLDRNSAATLFSITTTSVEGEVLGQQIGAAELSALTSMSTAAALIISGQSVIELQAVSVVEGTLVDDALGAADISSVVTVDSTGDVTLPSGVTHEGAASLDTLTAGTVTGLVLPPIHVGPNRVNFMKGTLSGGISDVATIISSNKFADLPIIDNTNKLFITLDPEGTAGAPEVVKITAHDYLSTSITVERAYYGTARTHIVDTVWVNSILPEDFPIANYKTITTGGSITLTMTMTEIPGTDLSIPAKVGDTLEYGVDMVFNNGTDYARIEPRTIVNNVGINYIAQAPGTGFPYVWGALVVSAPVTHNSSVFYTVKAEDIQNGTVTIKIFVRRYNDAGNRQIWISAGIPLHMYVINWR